MPDMPHENELQNTQNIVPRAFSGVDRLYGNGSYESLKNASVFIVGIGGVGSWAAEAIARNGIRNISIIDLDNVAESNINRQIQAVQATLGMAKVDALAERIRSINPECNVTRIEEFLTPENITDLLAVRPDVVLDCTDQTAAKVSMALHCHRHDLALFMAGAAGGRADPTRIRRGDLADTQGDRLLSRVRALLRKSGEDGWPGKEGFHIEAVYSSEPMRRPHVDACDSGGAMLQGLSCAGYGSSVCVTGSFGFALAACAIEHLLKR